MRDSCFRLKLLLLSAILLPFLESSGAAKALAQEEVKLGVILPFARGLEQTGKSIKGAFELAAEIANNGAPNLSMSMARWKGIPGLGGKKIRLIEGDHRSDPERGAAIATRFISEEKVAGIIGCLTSSVTRSVSVVCEKARVPMLTATSTAQSLTTQGNRWLWRTCPNNVSRVAELFSFLEALADGRATEDSKVPKEDVGRLCVIAEATDMGDLFAYILKKAAPRHGIKLVLHIRYPRGASDLGIQAKAAARARPGVVAMVSRSEDAAQMIRKFKELGFYPRIIWGLARGLRDEAFGNLLGEDAEGVASRTDFSVKLADTIPLVGQVNSLYKAKTGRDLDEISALAFTGLQAFLHILDAARSTEPAVIQSAANGIEIPATELIMPWRGIKFGGEQQREIGQNIMASGVVVQWQRAPVTGVSGLEVVYPPRFATSKVIYPFQRRSD